ncbi:MAG: putative bifunctional diguanylate cyclase/phosphodiesterase [Actinomycetes bacterium]
MLLAVHRSIDARWPCGTRWTFYSGLALTICLTAGAVYWAAPASEAAMVAFAIAGLTCAAATVVGTLRHRPVAARSWLAMTATSVAFLVGGALRVSDRQFRATHLIPDLFTLCGYGFFLLAILGWLAARRGRRDWSSLSDALIVGLGAALAAWSAFIVPALQLPGLSAVHRVLFASYPVFDAVLLAVLLQMVFTQTRHNTAFNLFMLAMVGFFVGDVAYAAVDSGVGSLQRPVIDLPYFFAFGAVAAAALHPSMHSMAERDHRERSTRWDAMRTVIIAVSVLAVSVTPVLVPVRSTTDLAGRLVLSGAVVLAVVVRMHYAINRLADSEAAAMHQARHDSLTSLPNRAALVECLDGAWSRGSDPVTVLFLDLDGFKLVNDSYGHELGDELLAQVARRLSGALAPREMMARLGGDEFVVLTRVDTDAAVRVAERLLACLSHPFTLGVGELFLSASVGIATLDRHSRPVTGEDLVRDADIAMYEAKTKGRGRIAVFDASLRERVQRRISTEMALRYAVERDELELLYQPLVALSDGAVVGYEALLRWNHPERGQVSPAEFIPVAEETGLIVPMGEWAIREALRQLARWHDQGHHVHVSVNVSARQLGARSLVGTVAAALAESGVPGQALWLELTESALVEDPETALQTLTDITALGVRVAIDDFGTGYSSLGYLKRFPVSIVKIDREFVRDLSRVGHDAAIVRAVVAIGEALGTRVVAEGVERAEQARALTAIGCDMAQGWLYGRPQPASAVTWDKKDGAPSLYAARLG